MGLEYKSSETYEKIDCGHKSVSSVFGEPHRKRLGIPDRVQVDNAFTFAGSPKYPRSIGPLIRLCLHSGVEPWFIPSSEPWRNGSVERFNDFYQQSFLGRVGMFSVDELKNELLSNLVYGSSGGAPV